MNLTPTERIERQRLNELIYNLSGHKVETYTVMILDKTFELAITKIPDYIEDLSKEQLEDVITYFYRNR